MKSKFYFMAMGLMIVLASYSVAQVPQMINSQGKLTTPSGAPVTDTVQMVFSIYADEGGATLLWTETQTEVIVEKGVFNVLLGSVNAIPDSVFDGNIRYLGVKVGGDPEITPRKPMVSVAYAYKSFEADTADYARAGVGGGIGGSGTTNYVSKFTDATTLSNSVIYESSGNIGIGTTSPAYKLDVSGNIRATGTIYGTVDNADRVDGYHAGNSSGQVPVSNGAMCSNLNADRLDGAHLSDLDGMYVNEGQVNSVTSGMITDDQIVNADISATANIVPSKIFGTAWTSLNDGSGSGLDADLLDGQHASAFLTTANDYGRSGVATDLYEGTSTLTDRYVNEGQANSVTSGMIVDSQIVDADISPTANITPSKISGTAWTSTNDGSGSGLDADLLDGQHASAFLTTANDYGRSGVASDLYEGTSTLTDKYVNEGQANSVTSGMIADNTIGRGDVASDFKAPYADTADYARAATADKDWTFRLTDGNDTTLIIGGAWGIARYGNTLYGTADSTHVNLGVASTTGTTGQNYKYCTVGGGAWNIASGNWATVGGGFADTAQGEGSTVGGGWGNGASAQYATIAGGDRNYASQRSAAVGGGAFNYATGQYATVGGGWNNIASGNDATVGGGANNQANGYRASVPGGFLNTVDGDYSLAGGREVTVGSDADYTFAFGSNFTTSASHAVIFHDTGTPIKMGIGTTSPTTTLHVQGDALVKSTGGSVALSGSDGAMEIWGTDGAFIDLKDSESDDYDFRITQVGGTSNLDLLGGNVGIGLTSPSEKLDVNGTARLRSMSTGTGTDVVVDANGVLLKKSSSIRYKQNIRRLNSTPDQILQLNPVRFNWKTTGEEDVGLIAEEVEKIVPDLVIYDKEGKPDAVKYDKMTVYLLELVKAQQKELGILRAKLEKLESTR